MTHVDVKASDPFPFYDAEVKRMRQHLSWLDEIGWNSPSHCTGWTVRDVLSHLAAGESYNQNCLDSNLDQLSFSGGLDAWNDRAVRSRRSKPGAEVFEEWSTRQQEVRRRWGELGLDKEIQTSVGPYPLQLQVWHLAQEYATHADDIRVRVPVEEREVRDRWRIAFGLFAAEEEGRSVPAELGDSEVRLDLGDRVEAVDLETFIAFLTRRPQHLDDLTRRQAVDRLIHHMDVERAGR